MKNLGTSYRLESGIAVYLQTGIVFSSPFCKFLQSILAQACHLCGSVLSPFFFFLTWAITCGQFDPQRLVDQPEGADEAGRHREGGDVVRFGEGPVVGGKGPRQRALTQGDDKVDAPEESHGIVDLEVEEVPQEEALVVVLEEYAAGRGATGELRGVKGLGGGRGGDMWGGGGE